MRRIILVVLLSVCSLTAVSKEDDQIDRLFTAMNADSMIDMMYQQMGQVFGGMRQQMNISKDEEFIFEKFDKQMVEIMRSEMSWEKMAPAMRNLYKQNFTTAEIAALVEFYESPVGQSFIQKMPLVTQESMMIGQQMAMQAMPKIQAASEALKAELSAYREKNSQ